MALVALSCLIVGPASVVADLAAPAWYDQNAVGTAPDWHYRVPLNIPAGTPVDSTVRVDVDFNVLLGQLGVTGLFDPNSPRVVRAGGALSTQQEFSDTRFGGATDPAGNGRGELRFILEDPGAVSYFLYFDITQNGVKPANPATPINGGFETGGVGTTTPVGWTMARANANFDAQIRGSENVNVNTNGGFPDPLVTDGTPFSGSQSYLMGGRTNNEPSNSNPAVTLTKTFTMPPACASGFSMRYRPEGWDSSWANQTRFDFIRITLSSGATNVVLVGPDAPGANGNYQNLPYSPNFSSNSGAASNNNSGYGPYNGFDTNNRGGHEIGMTLARGAEPWFNPINNLAAFAAGSTITLTVTSSNFTQYKSWFHLDDVEWCVVPIAINPAQVQGFGANITVPTSGTTHSAGQALAVTVQTDAMASAAANPVIAYVFNPSGTLIAGPVNLPVAGAGAYSNANVYTFLPGDPTGTWTVRIFAKDASVSTIGATSGLLHIPGQPNPEIQANFFNIDEQTFELAGPSGFNAFDLPLPAGTTPVSGSITTKVSGIAFSVGLIRLNSAKTAVNSAYNQTGVTVSLLDSSDDSGALDAVSGCRPTWTAIAGASTVVNFIGGKATVSFSIPNAYRNVRVQVNYAGTPIANQGTGCSNDNFAIRPQSFGLQVTDATWTSAGTTRVLNTASFNGAPVHKAGRPFSLRVNSVVPATATNFLTAGGNIGSPTQRSLNCTLPSGGAPACTACNNGVLTTGVFAAAGGGLISNTASYTEAGTFDLDLHDVNFAAVDLADGTPDTYSNASPVGTFNQFGRRVPQTATVAVGRFVPDNFLVTPVGTPQFRTYDDVCIAARSFTYVGQPFGYATAPQVLVTAREAGGATTTNYGECLWKIAPTALDVARTYSNKGVGPALDTGLAANAPAITVANNGTGTIVLDSADRLSYLRTTPIVPFFADISLSIAIRDASEVDGPITGTSAVLFDPIGFDSGNEFRFGRLRIGNVAGTTRLDLPFSIQAQYYTANGFVVNAGDSCTRFSTTDISNSFVAGTGLQACETAIAPNATHTLAGGAVPGIRLLTPGSGNAGAVDVQINLSASSGNTCTAIGVGPGTLSTNAGLPYLQGNWGGSLTWDQDPSARMTFGIYNNAAEFLYLQENY